MNEEIFSLFESLTFDDLLVEPGYSEILPSQTDVRGRLAENIWLNIPILSAAMDTVTEGRLAIALAREGGIGIIHRNLSPEAQAREVEVVKRSESGMISDPVTLPPTATLQEAEDIMQRFHISGIPVVDPGSQKLVGILTNRDIRFTGPEDYSRPLSDFMTSENLVTAPLNTTLEQAKMILQKHRIEKLPLVDERGHLKGLITVKDIQKKVQFPAAATDSRGRLMVGAAVGVGVDLEKRTEMMAEEGVDVLVELAEAMRADDHLHFVIAGDGADKQRLQELAAGKKLGNLTFLPFLSQPDYFDLLQDVQLCFIAQRKGTGDVFFPSKLLGIMAMSKPVLISADMESELARFIRKRNSGLTVDSAEVGQLAASVRRLFADPKLLKELGENAREAVKEFDREAVLGRLLDWMRPAKGNGHIASNPALNSAGPR